MSDMRAVIVETMEAHRTRRAWAYGGSGLKHDETHDNGTICMCGWARMSDETGVVGPAGDAHRADMIALALVKAGLVDDFTLALETHS